MSRSHSFLVKTKGWLLTAGTIPDVIARADYSTYTNNGRFAWAERTKIELTGIAANREVVFPMGWNVQELVPPEGYAYGTYNLDFAAGPPATIPNGLPFYCEIHDIWSTVPLSDADLGLIVGATNNEQYGPAMEGNAQITLQAPYMDFEQVIAARSRVWGPSAAPLDYSTRGEPPIISSDVRQQFCPLMHDCTWGSGEPIANLDFYHVRCYIAGIDTMSGNVISNQTGTFCTMPSSIQPMAVQIAKPDFLSRMTMERRSKGV